MLLHVQCSACPGAVKRRRCRAVGQLSTLPGLCLLAVQGPTPLRFFAGACTWGPGELEEQLEQGAWTCAAASRSLVLKPCIQLPVPLWQELACLLGDERAARRAKRAPRQAPGSPAPQD